MIIIHQLLEPLEVDNIESVSMLDEVLLGANH